MLENRSFDHIMGFLKQTLNKDIDGLNGNETNPYHPSDPNSKVAQVNHNAPYVDPDPGHSIQEATLQIFGGPENLNIETAPMNGFVASAEGIQKGMGIQIMNCFNSTMVPAISTLAAEFAVFDHWFSSVPGPTEVNRAYVHSATSHGMGYNDVTILAEGLPNEPIFMSLQDAGATWTVYMEEISTTLFFQEMRNPLYVENYGDFDEFLDDAASGDLPNYAFIEPRYLDFLSFPANDQHPSHDVSQGEMLVKTVYDALRNGPLWNSTLFIVTYDEHGGFFDHVPTPLHHVPNPDGLNSTNPVFNFTRLGIRVPMVMASPWIEKGTVVHNPSQPHTHYEHSSIPATLKKMFNTQNFLTERDKWAATFEDVFMTRTTPRTDCPISLPSPPGIENSVATNSPMNDLQKGLIALAAVVSGEDEIDYHGITTEFEGSLFARKCMSKFFKNEKWVKL